MDDITCNGTRLDHSRPSNKSGYANSTLGKRPFTTSVNTKSRHVGEELKHWSIVCHHHDNGIVIDTLIFQQLEHLTKTFVHILQAVTVATT